MVPSVQVAGGRRCLLLIFRRSELDELLSAATSCHAQGLLSTLHGRSRDGGCATPKPEKTSPAHSRRPRFVNFRLPTQWSRMTASSIGRSICTPLFSGLRFSLANDSSSHVGVRRLRTARLSAAYCPAAPAPGMQHTLPAYSYQHSATRWNLSRLRRKLSLRRKV